MAQEPGSEKCVCVAERRPLRVLRLQKRETCTFEFVLVWVYFERKGFESGFRDQTLRWHSVQWPESVYSPTESLRDVDLLHGHVGVAIRLYAV